MGQCMKKGTAGVVAPKGTNLPPMRPASAESQATRSPSTSAPASPGPGPAASTVAAAAVIQASTSEAAPQTPAVPPDAMTAPAAPPDAEAAPVMPTVEVARSVQDGVVPLLQSSPDPTSLAKRLAQGSRHVWLLASWKNPHLVAAPLLPLDIPLTAKLGPSATAASASAAPTRSPLLDKKKSPSPPAAGAAGSEAGGADAPLVSFVHADDGGATTSAPALSTGRFVGGVECVSGLARGYLFARRPGDMNGGEVKLSACNGASIVLMTQLSKVVVEDCHRCFLFIGPTSNIVTLTRCTNCVVVVLANRLEFKDCLGILCSAHTMGLPVLTSSREIYMAAFSAWFTYNELPLHLRAAGLSPFVNNYSTVLDRTPTIAAPQTPKGPLNTGTLGSAAALAGTNGSGGGGQRAVPSHSPNYHCISSFVMDLLLCEWWVRVERAKREQADGNPLPSSPMATPTPESAPNSIGGSAPLFSQASQKSVLDVYAAAREQWTSELDAFRPPHALMEQSVMKGSRVSLVDLADVDLANATATPPPAEDGGAEEAKASGADAAKDKEDKRNALAHRYSRGPHQSMLKALGRLYVSPYMNGEELKLRGVFLTAPVVFLSAVVAGSPEAGQNWTDLDAAKATTRADSASPSPSSSPEKGKKQAPGSATPGGGAVTTEDLYFRLRTLMRQRAVCVASVKPPFTPRSLPDVRRLFEFAAVVPATFGVQHIPAACFQQHWRLKLFVATAKGGGWAIANRVLGDVERYRRKAVLDTIKIVGDAQGVAEAKKNGESVAEAEQNVQSVIARTLNDVQSRYGPVLLLNTAELRCSDIIMREFVAPTFYRLTEPVEVRRARHAREDGTATTTTTAGDATTHKHHLHLRVLSTEKLKHVKHNRNNSSSGSGGGPATTGAEQQNAAQQPENGGIFGRAKRLLKTHVLGFGSESGSNSDDDDDDVASLRDDQMPSAIREDATTRPASRVDDHDHDHNHGAPAPLPSGPPTTAAEAASVSRHLVAMRRLFGDAIQRMSGQTCVLMLALVAPTPLSATRDIPPSPALAQQTSASPPPPPPHLHRGLHPRSSSPSHAQQIPSPTSTAVAGHGVPVALQHGLPADPMDVFQPLTTARAQVLQLANSRFERQQSIVQPLLSPSRAASQRADCEAGVDAAGAGDVEKDGAGSDGAAYEDDDSLSGSTNPDFLSCIEGGASTMMTTTTRSRRRTHLRDAMPLPTSPVGDSVELPPPQVPEARVQLSRLKSDSMRTEPQPQKPQHSHPPQAVSVPVASGPSAEEQVWPSCVVLNVSLPLRFVNVLQGNVFFKGCVSSHQIASAKPTAAPKA